MARFRGFRGTHETDQILQGYMIKHLIEDE
jgi:succinate dehydrogenase flavin-adding protein (antitoxin of CptAB toxin-antitoxin module)